jgi:hypothetical protein
MRDQTGSVAEDAEEIRDYFYADDHGAQDEERNSQSFQKRKYHSRRHGFQPIKAQQERCRENERKRQCG